MKEKEKDGTGRKKFKHIELKKLTRAKESDRENIEINTNYKERYSER